MKGINNNIKPFIAHLFRLGINKYIYSANFKYLCLEFQIDEIWEKKLRAHVNDSMLVTTRFDNAFYDLISTIYEVNIDSFLNFICSLLLDFVKNNDDELNFSIIYNDLKIFGIQKNKLESLVHSIDDYYSKKNQYSLKKFELNASNIFTAGQQYDALRYIVALLEKAEKSITLIDGYIDTNTLDILIHKENKIVVNILTKASSVTNSLKNFIKAFNAQYFNLNIRTSEEFHDRFIIIDDKDIYTLGASIKDAGKKTFMFSSVNEEFIKSILIKKFNENWNKTANIA